MWEIENRVMLITYPDSLGGNLRLLRETLKTHLDGAVGGIHILPFFPSSADRGFSPITYDRVDPAFGDWSDIETLSRDYYLMCDMMINHISRQSEAFRDFLRNGDSSPYAPLFINYDTFFGGDPSPEELSKIYRRSDKPPYVAVLLPDGAPRRLWCTFSQEQIDLDTAHPVTRRYLMDNLRGLGQHGLSLVRLDAYGYITKVRGSNCFFVEPDIWDLISACGELLHQQHMTLLPEVHDRYETALKIAEHGYWTYDFVLPLLMLHTLTSGSGAAMKRWFTICPRKQFTVLDTHDGVGVYDAAGIVGDGEAQAAIADIEENLSYSFKPLDPARKKNYRSYQLYGTYYSMLKKNDQALLLARALQFFAPGIPQVYYVGLLAGENQLDFPAEDHRFINRKNYSMEELDAQFQRPVVRRLRRLMRLRNSHPAFDGELVIGETPDHILSLAREKGDARATLFADLRTHDFYIHISENGRLIPFGLDDEA